MLLGGGGVALMALTARLFIRTCQKRAFLGIVGDWGRGRHQTPCVGEGGGGLGRDLLREAMGHGRGVFAGRSGIQGVIGTDSCNVSDDIMLAPKAFYFF